MTNLGRPARSSRPGGRRSAGRRTARVLQQLRQCRRRRRGYRSQAGQEQTVIGFVRTSSDTYQAAWQRGIKGVFDKAGVQRQVHREQR